MKDGLLTPRPWFPKARTGIEKKPGTPVPSELMGSAVVSTAPGGVPPTGRDRSLELTKW